MDGVMFARIATKLFRYTSRRSLSMAITLIRRGLRKPALQNWSVSGRTVETLRGGALRVIDVSARMYSRFARVLAFVALIIAKRGAEAEK